MTLLARFGASIGKIRRSAARVLCSASDAISKSSSFFNDPVGPMERNL